MHNKQVPLVTAVGRGMPDGQHGENFTPTPRRSTALSMISASIAACSALHRLRRSRRIDCCGLDSGLSNQMHLFFQGFL